MHKRVFTTALALLCAACLLAGCSKTPFTPGKNPGTTPPQDDPPKDDPTQDDPTEIVGATDYLTHGETHTQDKNFSAGYHTWGTDNTCTVCGYTLPVTEGLIYTAVEGGLKVGYDWENATLTAAETVVIPAYHDGKKVVEVQGYYDGQTASETRFAGAAFKTVSVPSTVKTIPTFTFFGNEALETAYIGGGTLGDEVFACSSVKKAIIKAQSIGDMTFTYTTDGKTMTPCPIEEAEIDCTGAIGGYTFYTCPNLVKAKIAGATVGDCTFYRCAALEEAEILHASTIGERTFQECKALEKVTLPENLSAIPAKMFWFCTHLRECEIPETVTEIGDYAFDECRHLIRITLPAGLQTVGEDAFKLCGRLAEICNLSDLEFEPHAENPANEVSFLGVYTDVIVTEKSQMGTFTEKDDFLFYKSAAGKNYLVCYDGDTADLTLPAAAPDGSKYVVHGYAFDTLDFDLTSVTIGDGVTALGYGAFSNCKKLTSVTFGNCLERIGDYCFNSTPLLTEVTLPASLNYIGHAAFWTSRSTYGLQRATFAEPTGWTWQGDAKEPVDLSNPAQNAQYLAHTSNGAPNLYWQRTTTD